MPVMAIIRVGNDFYISTLKYSIIFTVDFIYLSMQ